MKNKPQKRWIKSVIAASREECPALPWQRGRTRAQFIAKRQSMSLKVKSA